MRARIAAHQFEHRMRDRLQQRVGNPGGSGMPGHRDSARIFGGDQALSPAMRSQQTARAHQRSIDSSREGSTTRRQFLRAIDRRGAGRDRECRRRSARDKRSIGTALLFDFCNGVGIEQLAQVGFAQQLAQLVLIDGERLGAALGQRRIAVVE
jgi:hypothetical protein